MRQNIMSASWLQDMYLWLEFSPKRLRVFTNKNVDDICNVMRKPGVKNADGTPDTG